MEVTCVANKQPNDLSSYKWQRAGKERLPTFTIQLHIILHLFVHLFNPQQEILVEEFALIHVFV